MTCVSAHCPDCEAAGRDSLRKIGPTGEKHAPHKSSEYWVIEHHGDGQGNLCPGSGKRI